MWFKKLLSTKSIRHWTCLVPTTKLKYLPVIECTPPFKPKNRFGHIDEIIKSNKRTGTYAYLDNITVGGKTQEEHDANLEKFLKVAKDCNLT